MMRVQRVNSISNVSLGTLTKVRKYFIDVSFLLSLVVSFSIVASCTKAPDTGDEKENFDYYKQIQQIDKNGCTLDCAEFKIEDVDDYSQTTGNFDDKDVNHLWRTEYLDEIFTNKISDYIGQDDNDPPDDKLLTDLFSSKTSKRESQVEHPIHPVKCHLMLTANGENRKSKGVTGYFKRSICNYIKRKELKFNYLRGLYHEHLNHQSHLDLLSSTTKDELQNRKIGFIGDGDNECKQNQLPRERDTKVKVDEKKLKFYIYGKSNLSEQPMIKIPQLSLDDETIHKLSIDMRGKHVAIATHGYWNDIFVDNQQELKNALLNKFDLVILFDWSAYCQPLEFFSASENLFEVSHILGGYITKLVDFKGLDTENLHLFGYSLGAHLMAFTSRNMMLRKPGSMPVKKLTAFDPALPMFRTKGLSKKDARIVQVIHTNAGTFGQTKQLGHYDYYPNGGSNQPGCPDSRMASLTMQAQTCDHGRAIMLFTYIVGLGDVGTNLCEFVGYPCQSYEQYLDGKCHECVITNEETQECLQMSLMDHKISQQPKMNDLPRLFFLGGEPENLCLANYVVKIHFENVVSNIKRAYGQQKIDLSISSVSSTVNICVTVGLYDKTASKLFTLPKTVKVDLVEMVSNETGKGVEMIEIKYLSHSDKRIRDEYSSSLRPLDTTNEANRPRMFT